MSSTTPVQNVSQVIKIGPAQVSYGSLGTNMTFMSVKGATVKWAPKTTDATVSKYGTQPVATYFNGGELTAEFEISQTDYLLLSSLSLGVTMDGAVTAGTPSPTYTTPAAGIGMVAGQAVTARTLTITPENINYQSGNPTTNFSFTIWLAVPTGQPEIMYTSEGAENVYKVAFKALYDPTHDLGGSAWTDAQKTLGCVAPMGIWGNPSPA